MDFKDDELTNEQIMKLIQKYKNKRINEKKYYHNVTKTKEEFKVKNRENAKKHYEEKGREMKKKSYEKNKDMIIMRNNSRPSLTSEQRRIYNKNYYEKKKAKNNV